MISGIAVKILPIFLLTGLGVFIRYYDVVSSKTIDDFKKIILNFSLPAVLFFSFFRIELHSSYILIVITIFLVCIILYFLGFAYQRKFYPSNEYVAFYMTGFEFGMMGAVFFGAAFGMENLGYIGVIGLGHELFIWFVYVTLLKSASGDFFSLKKTLLGFVRSPLILAIAAGIFCNLLKLEAILESLVVTQALFATMDYLVGLLVPMILIVLGYNIKLDTDMFSKGIPVVLTRIAAVFVCLVLTDLFLFRTVLKLEPLFSAALYVFFLLPPPFIIPLFIHEQKEKLEFMNSIIVLYSLISIVLFAVFYGTYVALTG